MTIKGLSIRSRVAFAVVSLVALHFAVAKAAVPWSSVGVLALAEQKPPPERLLVHLCSAEMPPFYARHLPEQGPVIQQIRHRFAARQLKIDLQFMPWARAYQQALAGHCALVGLWPSPERDLLFDYSKPLLNMRLGYFAAKNNQTMLNIMAKPNVTLGVQRGAYLNSQVALQFPTRVESVDITQALAQLAKGRVDLVFANREAGLYHLSQHADLAKHIEYRQDVEEKQAVLAFAKVHPLGQFLLAEFATTSPCKGC